MKYSAAFERDWAFYTANLDTMSFSGSPAPTVAHDPDGPDAKRAFHDYDSRGVLRATSEPDLLRRVLVTKASVNLHVRMWAEGIADATLLGRELEGFKQEFGAPQWVVDAVRRTASRIRSARV